MRIAYLHYLYGEDTALHHVRQFAAAAGALGHEVEIHAMNLAPPLPAAGHPGALGAPSALDGPGALDALGTPNAPGAPGAPGAHGAHGAPESLGSPVGSRGRLAGLRLAARQRLGRYLHEPKELLWNGRYVVHELRRLAAGPRPDVLLVRDHPLTASTVAVAARLGLPLVYEINAPAAELALYLDEHLHVPLAAAWLERLKLSRADAVITVSTALREHLLARHGLRGRAADRIAVVPNGADLAAFQPLAEPSPLARRALGIGGGVGGRAALPAAATCPASDARDAAGAHLPDDARPPVVGFVGSFQAFHGIELLVEMVLRVARLRPRVRFLLVGDGPGAAMARLRLAPLGERVVMTGAVAHDEVPGLVAAFDVGVLPETSFYACPLKVIEWMAAGKAVVAPRYGPLDEVLAHGEEGLLFAPRDLGALVGAVVRLVDRPALRQRLGAAAAARARSSLSWTDNARRVAAVLDQARGSALATGRVQPDLSPLG